MLRPIFFATCFFEIEKINGAPFGAPFILGTLDFLDFLEPLDSLAFKPAISSLPQI